MSIIPVNDTPSKASSSVFLTHFGLRLLKTVSAVGVPLIGEFGEAQLAGYVAGPGPALVDNFIRKMFGEDPLGDTAEDIFKVFTNAITGRIGTEMLMGGD